MLVEEEEVRYQASQTVLVLSHVRAVIMVVVGSKKFHRADRGEEVLMDVDRREETPLGRLGYGHQNIVTGQADFDVVSNQTSCSMKVIARGKAFDSVLGVSGTCPLL